MLHGQSLCYRVNNIFREEVLDLDTLGIEELDPEDPEIFRRLLKEFGKARAGNVPLEKNKI